MLVNVSFDCYYSSSLLVYKQKQVAKLESSTIEFIHSEEKESVSERLNPKKLQTYNEVGTLTDLHSDGVACTQDQVELISLLEERLPRYQLRADAITSFTGYEHEDWVVQSPCIPADVELNLSPQLTEETLKYFVYSGTRVSQMTRVYNDIAAVTLLLQEKERDLELAARIGQNLLYENQSLRTRNDELDDLLHEATEKVSQLQHVICVKDALLRVYYENSSDESPQDSPKLKPSSQSRAVDALRCKIRELEEENTNLRIEHAQLTNEASDIEVREAELVSDCVRRLADDRIELEALHEELKTRLDENSDLTEQVKDLQSKLSDTNRILTRVVEDNIDLRQRVDTMTEQHEDLVKQVSSWEDKYDECFALLTEARDNVHELEKQRRPGVLKYHNTQMSPYLSADTLAIELEESLHHDMEYPDGYTPSERKLHNLQVMSTVKAVKGSGKTSSVHHASSTKSSHRNTSLLSIGLDSICDDSVDGAPDSRSALVPSPCPPALYRRMPEPLQIIKPLTGSYALHRWQRLATPNLSAVLTTRPGIQIKGEEMSDRFTEQIYSLSDPEEDDDNTSTLGEELKLLRRGDSLDDLIIASCSGYTSSHALEGPRAPPPVYTRAGCPSVCSTTSSSEQDESEEAFAARFFKRLLKNASKIFRGGSEVGDEVGGNDTGGYQGQGDAGFLKPELSAASNWSKPDTASIGLNSITSIKRSARSRRYSRRGLLSQPRLTAGHDRPDKSDSIGLATGFGGLATGSSIMTKTNMNTIALRTDAVNSKKSKAEAVATSGKSSLGLPDVVPGLASNVDSKTCDNNSKSVNQTDSMLNAKSFHNANFSNIKSIIEHKSVGSVEDKSVSTTLEACASVLQKDKPADKTLINTPDTNCSFSDSVATKNVGEKSHGLTVVIPTAKLPGQKSPARPNSLNVTPVYSPPVGLTIGSAVDPCDVKVDLQL